MSVREYSKLNEEEEHLNSEIEEYKRILRKLRKNKEQELNKEPKIPQNKIIALSDLPSPKTTKYFPLIKEDFNSRCKKCADLLLQYGREVL